MNRKFKTILCGMIAAAMMTALMIPLSGCESKTAEPETSSEESAVEFDANTQSEDTSSAESQTDSVKGSLQGVLDSLVKENSDYMTYKSYYPTATFTEKVDGNKLVLTAQGEGEYDPNGSWEFVQDGDYITYHDGDAEDYTGTMLFMDIADAVADSLGMDSNLMSGYINGLSISDIESDKFVLTHNEDGSTDYKLYMAETFEMKELDEMLVEGKILEDAAPLTDEFISTSRNVGKISVLLNGDKNGAKLLVKEYGTFDDLAVKSAVNMANAYQPAGYEAFAEKFTSFENAETDDYTVVVNPDDETLLEMISEKQDGSSYAIITFGKDDTREGNAEEIDEETGE